MIFQKLCDNEEFSILDSKKPSNDFGSLFIIKELPNRYGILTTQEHLAGISENEALQNRLGLSVIKPNVNLSSIGGAKPIKEFTKHLLNAEKMGYKAKSVFLVGIPGTGKTFFPKCFAGETNRLLIQLNLTLIMESFEPIARLNSVFEYLNNRHKNNPNDKYVILIDEIEKMIGNSEPIEKRILGRLLTVINDLNTEACEYEFDAIIFATANNLETILENNPELLRRGRFDELFFINLPTLEYAKDIFELYIKKFKIADVFESVSMKIDELLIEIKNKYQKNNPSPDRFPYSPAEIETFCKRIDFLRKAKNDELDKTDIAKNIEMIIPIIRSAEKGITKMTGQMELFVEI